MMERMRVNFGGIAPEEIEYNNGEVWLYRNITEEKDEEGNVYYTADGVHFTTKLSKDEVLAQKENYFINTTEPSTTERIDALESAVMELIGG